MRKTHFQNFTRLLIMESSITQKATISTGTADQVLVIAGGHIWVVQGDVMWFWSFAAINRGWDSASKP